MKKFKTLFVMVLAFSGLGCGSFFKVQSEPSEALVFFKDPKTGEKKSLGKTPLEMPREDLSKAVGENIVPGEFFTLLVEKQGFETQTFSIPASGFGTVGTLLNVKLKAGTTAVDEKNAKTMVDRLFLAQKFALANQFERAHLELDKLLGEFPTFARAMTMRASIYFAQKNIPESLKWYDEALKIDPQLEDAVRMSAKVRALQSGTRLPANDPKAGKP